LDVTKPPITYAQQALAVVRTTPLVPFHGKTTGFVIKYTPDHAIRFHLSGDPVEMLTFAYYPGQVSIEISGRQTPAHDLAHILTLVHPTPNHQGGSGTDKVITIVTREQSTMASTWNELLGIQHLGNGKWSIGSYKHHWLDSIYDLVPEDQLYDEEAI
jgi:hypothetical protein